MFIYKKNTNNIFRIKTYLYYFYLKFDEMQYELYFFKE